MTSLLWPSKLAPHSRYPASRQLDIPLATSDVWNLDETFVKQLISITIAMGDVQKKLQELSDRYQGLQGGEKATCIAWN